MTHSFKKRLNCVDCLETEIHYLETLKKAGGLDKFRKQLKQKVITVDPFKQVVKLGGIRIPPIGWIKTK